MENIEPLAPVDGIGGPIYVDVKIYENHLLFQTCLKGLRKTRYSTQYELLGLIEKMEVYLTE